MYIARDCSFPQLTIPVPVMVGVARVCELLHFLTDYTPDHSTRGANVLVYCNDQNDPHATTASKGSCIESGGGKSNTYSAIGTLPLVDSASKCYHIVPHIPPFLTRAEVYKVYIYVCVCMLSCKCNMVV